MSTTHTWKFFKSGGLDQVILSSDADLRHLDQLDPKLWVALSCPVKGLELDEKTLALIDTDGDGRIRVPEVLAAVKWAGAYLKNLSTLVDGDTTLSLSDIRDDTPEARAIKASAKQILVNLGKGENDGRIAVEDTSDTAKIFSKTGFNGDGIITAQSTDDAGLQALIADIISTQGSENDRSGLPGITQSKIEQFYADLAAFSSWSARGTDAGLLVAGEATADALAAVQAVRTKVDDYFARNRLLAFDPRATQIVNRSEAEYTSLAAKDLKTGGEELASFPIAKIEAGKPLPLSEGVNPAWSAALANLRNAAVAPLLGDHKTSLTFEEWSLLGTKLASYESWVAAKSGSAVEKLGAARIAELLAGQGKAALTELVAKDNALQAEALAIATVDRLTRYARDLGTLLRNFVNFADFYDPKIAATFQVGTLFLDSRSCDLCFRVDGPNPLAAMSKAYIAYCTVSRTGGQSMTIAACFTQGDSDYLFVGRHGIFYDRQGNDWDAVITSVVDNPISIRQAFWSPYKKFIRMVEEQVAKRAAAAQAESDAKIAAAAQAESDAKIAGAAESTANLDKRPAKQEPKKIDVGTVAALGVAAGAIMGALGAVATGLARLEVWQFPLVFVALILVVSGPSMIIAWIKLRQRTLGPILDANGWAVNGRVKINIPLGSSLTHVAKIPAGSVATHDDPFEDKDAASRRRLFIFVLFLLALGSVLLRWDHKRRGHYIWQNPPTAAAPAAPAPAPEAAPAPAK